MHRYGVRDVEKLLRLPRSTIRALVSAGFVAPARGARNAWLFSFQDLVVLRTARLLAAAKVSPRRITDSMRQLRRRLPSAMPLSGLRISAVGDRIIVKEGGRRWQADSGQYLLAFEGDPDDGSLNVVERRVARKPGEALAWFDQATDLETTDPSAASDAYARAIAADGGFLDAYVNLGRLLHEQGRHAQAERVYRSGLEVSESEPVLLFNLGVLLEELGRAPEALHAYEAAVRADPQFADCHYNLALLCDALGRKREAIRHMSHYRRLIGTKPG